MSYTLLIWEEVPETTHLFLIPNDVITPAQRELLKQAQGRLINRDDENPGLEFVNAAVTDPKYRQKPEDYTDDNDIRDRPSDQFFQDQCIWHQYEVPIKEDEEILRPITQVVFTGFML